MAYLGSTELLTDVLFLVDGATQEEWEALMENPAYEVGYWALLVGLLVLPPLSAWLAMTWVRRSTAAGTSRGRMTAIVAIVLYVLGIPLLGYLIDAVYFLPVVFQGALIVLAAIVLVALGAGSVFAWAARMAVRQLRKLGTLTSRALPLLLLFTTFGFLSAEIWQSFTALRGSQIWWVVGFFAVLAMLFMVAVLSDELHDLIRSRPRGADPAKLTGTPFEFFLDDHPAAVHPLRRVERLNMVLVLLLAQLIQAVAFGLLMFAIFVTFGSLAVRPEVMKAWSTHDLTSGTIYGIYLPFHNELLQVSIFLAAFSGLYFATSTATDARIRQSFFDPLIEHMAVNLSARHLYLGRWVGQPSGSTTQSTM
ncbi:hypothetical protein [Actinokineospora xionganensis]|uniref:hypothetical protein n=1 Tax=Actinokineospora xionganensis TaxID=2684470 RepID=UPI001FE9F4DA|nr:hypothetical protein [Actinokineospora xionganensis]